MCQVNNEIKWRKDKKGFSSPYDEMTFKLFNEQGISKFKFRNHVLNIYKKNFGFQNKFINEFFSFAGIQIPHFKK